MESVTGAAHSQNIIPGRSLDERVRGLLTAALNAAIEGAAQGGATEFLVNEAPRRDTKREKERRIW
jgi:D-amino peptidase